MTAVERPATTGPPQPVPANPEHITRSHTMKEPPMTDATATPTTPSSGPCPHPPCWAINIDPSTEDGSTLSACEAHTDQAVAYFRALGHVVLIDGDHGPFDAHCHGEPQWADPAAGVAADVARFMRCYAPLVAAALAGDRDALHELLVAHAATFEKHALR